MDPILLHVGPVTIYSYSALVNLGLLLGGVLVLLGARRRNVDLAPVVDAVLATAVGGLILGRVAYVGIHWAYYADHLRQAVRPWQGGLLWQGALLGGMIGAKVVCMMRGMRLRVLLDILTPGAASLAVFAWLACFMAGCAYGIETYPGQGLLWTLSLYLPDLYGIREPRVAVQLLGAGWSGLVLGTVLVARGQVRRGGTVFALWLALHSLGALGLGFLRADEMVSVGGWRLDQLANLALSVAGVALVCAQAFIRAERGS